MADTENTEKSKESEGLGSKLLTFVIILLIIIIWLAILALLIKFDVGGIGTNTFRPILKDVPVLNRILPDVSDEEIAYENKYPYKNLNEAVERIKELELLVDKYSEENADYAQRQSELQTEIDSLRHFEEEYETFLELREAFDRDVVLNDKALAIDEYLKWYESMYPENAAKIYEEFLHVKQANQTIQDIANKFAKMTDKQCAKILEEYTSDVDFVCEIFENLKDAKVTSILEAIAKDDSLFAARIVDRMNRRAQESLGGLK